MALSLAKIEKQIAALERQRDAIREGEVKEVVERIKIAIAHYTLTPEQLFGKKVQAKTALPTARAPTTAGASPATAKYADKQGNAWSGRGPRPMWLRTALSAGAQLESFLAAKPASDTSSTTALKPKTKKKTSAKRAPSKVIYADGSGKTWTGRGPRPGWVKAHVEGGKDLSELLQK